MLHACLLISTSAFMPPNTSVELDGGTSFISKSAASDEFVKRRRVY